MKIKFQKSKLEKAIKKLNPLTKTSVLPIVQNFHFSVKQNEAIITATNLNIYGRAKVECESKEEIDFLIEGGRFTQVISNCAEEIVMEFESEKRILKINSGQSKYKFSTEPASDYPVWEDIAPEAKVLNIPNLAEIFKRSLPTVSKEDLRRNMAGICISNAIVATDAFRLIKNNIETPVDPEILIPVEFSEIIANIEGEITLKYTPEDVHIEAGNYVFSSKLIDDAFPKFENVIPKGDMLVCSYTMNTQELQNAIKSVMISADAITHRIIFEFSDTNILKISALNTEIAAEAETTLAYEYESSNGTLPEQVTFNGKYMMSLLDVVKQEKVVIRSTGEEKRAFITEQPDLIYLIMPVSKEAK